MKILQDQAQAENSAVKHLVELVDSLVKQVLTNDPFELAIAKQTIVSIKKVIFAECNN